MANPVPLADPGRQNADLGVQLEEAMRRIVQSGRYVLADEVAAFEGEFAAFCGSRCCIGVANGTDAMELALRAHELGPGDHVATVANAGMYGTAAILATGARPVFIDVDGAILTMSAASLKERLTSRTKAVIVTHLYGRLAAMDELLAVARSAGLKVIEDCAQAHGAMRNGRRAGSIGDVGCFSFYPTKNLGALGDGGALVTDDEGLAERLMAMRQYGWRERFLSSPPVGRNSRLDEIQAAVLRCKLGRLPEWNERRRAIVQRYMQSLGPAEVQGPDAAGDDHVAHLCVVRTRSRDRLAAHLQRRQVQVSVHYPVPDYRQPSVVAMLGEAEPLPETEAATASVLSLPCFPEMTEEEVAAVGSALQTAEL